jgi:hypothetical protein
VKKTTVWSLLQSFHDKNIDCLLSWSLFIGIFVLGTIIECLFSGKLKHLKFEVDHYKLISDFERFFNAIMGAALM